MKTRGKTKVENPDYLGGDLLDDGENTNGYIDEKVDDTIPGRSESRIARNTGNKRTGRMPRVGQTRGRNEKHYQQLVESSEFKEVVQGFIEFIEEINKSRKKAPKKTARSKNGEARPAKPAEEPELQKKTKTEMLKPLSSEKPDLQPPSPSDASKLYKFKEDANTGKGLIDLIKDKEQNIHPSSYVQPPIQDTKTAPFAELRAKEALNKPGYQGGMMDFNHFDANPLNMLLKQQANKATAAANPYGYDNNMLKGILPTHDKRINNPLDVMQRMQMQSFSEQNPMRNYFMPSDYNYNKMVLDAFGVKSSQNELANLQMLEALLQKNQPNLLGPLFGNNPGTAALFGELPYMMQNINAQNQRFGNQSLGVELIQGDPEAINPKVYEGKLGRASTHVAIAYFIYFKSLDAETIAKSDKSKVDPTYNARILKEKKYESFPPENPMLNKFLPGFENRLSSLGLGGGLPLEYLGNPEIQRLLAQHGMPEQLREAQLQRLQQEALLRSNEELIQTRGGNYQGKNNDIKLEEKDEKARRAAAANTRANERGNRQTPKHNPTKEDEIIEIKENSDAEVEEEKVGEMKIETKDEVKSEATEKKSSSAMQIEKPEGAKGKGIDESINAEDMVEEITELTGSGFDANKAKRGKPSNIKKPVKKPSEEQQRPSPHIAPKVYAMNEEHEPGQTHTETKPTRKGEGKGVQVISSDESPNRMQEEVEEKTERKVSTNPQ